LFGLGLPIFQMIWNLGAGLDHFGKIIYAPTSRKRIVIGGTPSDHLISLSPKEYNLGLYVVKKGSGTTESQRKGT